MKIVETIALISINATMVFQLLSFLLFLFLIHRIMIRPLARIMEERGRLLGRIEEDIAGAKENYVEIQEQMELQEADARDAAFKIRDDIEASGEKAAAELIARTRAEIERLKNKAQQETAAHIEAARAQMKNEAALIGERMIARLMEL